MQPEDLELESEFKQKLKEVFERSLAQSVAKYGKGNFADHIGDALKDSEIEVVKLVVPRSVRKWASPRVAEKLSQLMKEEPEATLAIRAVGVSIANTLRPIAGNRFTALVKAEIEGPLEEAGIGCATSGKIKTTLNRLFNEAQEQLEKTESEQAARFKPDLDIICYEKETEKPFLIISCKTSFAERLMQTVSWDRYVETLTPKVQLAIFVVTAWEDLDNPTQRNRVRVLDGAYIASEKVAEDEKVKRLSKIVPDIIRLRDKMMGRPTQGKF